MDSYIEYQQCAVSHILIVSGADVNCICSQTEESSLDVKIVNRNTKFGLQQ